MSKKMCVSEVMTPAPVTIQVDQSLEIARKLMTDYECRHLPVMEDQQLVGVVSDRDVNLALSFDQSNSDRAIIRDVFVGSPYCADVNDHLPKVLQDMVTLHISSALILDDSKLVGIFTTMDACTVLSQFLLER